MHYIRLFEYVSGFYKLVEIMIEMNELGQNFGEIRLIGFITVGLLVTFTK
jgi:hypothetical protein